MPPERSAMHVSGDSSSATPKDDRRLSRPSDTLIGKVPSLDKLYIVLSGMFCILILYWPHDKSRTPGDAVGEAIAVTMLGFSNLIIGEEDSESHHIVGACKCKELHHSAAKQVSYT